MGTFGNWRSWPFIPRKLWVNPTSQVRHLSNLDEKSVGIYRAIERGGFDWQVFFVAASGFLTDSYNLFATNIILPAIAFIYWRSNGSSGEYDPNDDTNGRWEVAINIATLGGSVVGQLLFGYLADRFGRRKLYGIELIIVIVSTLGLAQTSAGFYDQDSGSTSMSIQAWLIFYRLLQGVGIGGEYPMSAVITAEFASLRSRARMMAAVFMMQPIGQLLAAVIGIGVLYGYASFDHNDTLSFGPYNTLKDSTANESAFLAVNVQVDKVWRWVIGVGAIPAFIAILFRLTIPESPRYTLDVEEDATRALQDALAHFPLESRSSIETQEPSAEENAIFATDDGIESLPPRERSVSRPRQQSLDAVSPGASPAASLQNFPAAAATVEPVPFWKGLSQYLFDDGNWRWLVGASLTWFILDFAFYGLGVNNPRTVAKMWASRYESSHSGPQYENSWNSDIDMGNSPLSNDDDNIFFVMRNDALRSLITSTLGSLIGSILIIQIIPYVPRKTMLVWTFVVLAILMIVTGGVLFAVFEKDAYAVVITLYVIIQVVFNLGPNTLVFIYPAEIFPTRYRGTCYGIASASGKLAACIVQAILPFATFNGHQNRKQINDATALGYLWIIWGLMMFVGAYVAWLWLPQVQKARSEGDPADGFRITSMTLEELAKGRNRSTSQSNGVTRRRIPFLSKALDGNASGHGDRGEISRPNGNAVEMQERLPNGMQNGVSW